MSSSCRAGGASAVTCPVLHLKATAIWSSVYSSYLLRLSWGWLIISVSLSTAQSDYEWAVDQMHGFKSWARHSSATLSPSKSVLVPVFMHIWQTHHNFLKEGRMQAGRSKRKSTAFQMCGPQATKDSVAMRSKERQGTEAPRFKLRNLYWL